MSSITSKQKSYLDSLWNSIPSIDPINDAVSRAGLHFPSTSSWRTFTYSLTSSQASALISEMVKARDSQ